MGSAGCRRATTVPLRLSVRTGSHRHAAAGLLARQPARTHGESLHLSVSLDPTIQARHDGWPLVARSTGIDQAAGVRPGHPGRPQHPARSTDARLGLLRRPTRSSLATVPSRARKTSTELAW
jgi:hypothetical protein